LFDEAISIMNSIQADVRAAAQAQGEEKVSEFPAPQLIGELKNRIMRMCRNKEISADDAFNYGRATRWFVKKMRKTNDKEERQKLIKEYNEIIDPLIDIDPCSKGLFWAVTLAILATMLVAAPVLTATVSLSTASKAVLASGFAGAIFGGSTTRDKIDTTKTTEAVDKATPTDVPLPRPSSTEAVHKAIPTDAQSPRPSSTGGAAAPSKKTILYKI
jgi:hypothetical protein